MASEKTLRTFLLTAIAALALAPIASFAAGVSFTTDLHYGMQGSDVGQLQDFLRAEGFFNGDSTGNFFSATLASVTAWQAAHCVPATGYFGPLSRQAAATGILCSDSAPSPVSSADSVMVEIDGKWYVRTDHGLVPISGGRPLHRAAADEDSSPTSYTLTIIEDGGGDGTVTSSPAGINCGSTCSADFAPGTTVTLTATADPDNTFYQWSGGGCSGAGSCVVTMDAATTVTASFIVDLHMEGGGG